MNFRSSILVVSLALQEAIYGPLSGAVRFDAVVMMR